MMRRGTWTILSQTCRFNNYWQNLQRKNAGLLNYSFLNLKREPTIFIQNSDSRCMSLANQFPILQTDIQKFLKHLVSAYTLGKNSKFENLLEDYSIKRLIDERIQIEENIQHLKELGGEDKEMKKLAKEEMLVNENRLEEIDLELLDLISQNLEENNYDDIILEITAGVGGQESMFFVKDLLEMYQKHLIYLGYNFDITEIDESSQGGIRHASLMISGKKSFEKLRHEAGVHRVQRVPVTEKSGRIHTSVVSVAVLPQPNEVEVTINPKDLKIDTMRASGAGGQHVNTTDSAVRITHLPTGIATECQTHRSQLQNRELALVKLRAKIYEKQLHAQVKSVTSLRKQQMGMGERHEKIRTYNFNQDRITDHRIADGTFHNLKDFMEGGEALDNLHLKLNEELHFKLLSEVVKNVH